jgi:hypothetical protein
MDRDDFDVHPPEYEILERRPRRRGEGISVSSMGAGRSRHTTWNRSYQELIDSNIELIIFLKEFEVSLELVFPFDERYSRCVLCVFSRILHGGCDAGSVGSRPKWGPSGTRYLLYPGVILLFREIPGTRYFWDHFSTTIHIACCTL